MTEDRETGRRSRSMRTTAQDFPRDRFDDVLHRGRVGAHRVTSQPRVGWQFVVGGVVAAAILTTAGFIGVNFLNSIGKLPDLPEITQTGEPAEGRPQAVKAEIDPEATIVVLDGTSEFAELAAKVVPVVTDNDLGVISFAGPAAELDVELSAVFYKDPADESAALGLAKELGGLSAYATDAYADYDARLIVLLGSNYSGPGSSN